MQSATTEQVVENGWYRGRTGLSSRQDEGRLRVSGPGTRPEEKRRDQREPPHQRTKFILDEDRIPRACYNIAADLQEPPPPPLHPGTGQPIGPGDLAPLFPMELIKQVVSTDREIEIPEPVREAYALYRPSPLYRAHRLEKALDTPAHIYYKYEGVSPAGSHKPNTALRPGVLQQAGGRHAPGDRDRRRPVGQRPGVRRRGLRARAQGLHGPRELRPEAVPAHPDGDLRRRRSCPAPARHPVRPEAPGARTPTTRARWASPSARRSRTRSRIPDTKYSLGSVLRLRAAAPDGHRPGGHRADGAWPARSPDVVIGCVGGGSNFAGLAFPLIGRQLRGEAKLPRSSRSSRGGAVADPRALQLRLRRHGRDGAAGQDAHARATTSCRRRSMPAACATTACRRWSASSSTTA